MIKVVLLGAGNVASHLFAAFEKTTATSVIQVYNRTKKALYEFQGKTNITTDLSQIIDADVYIIAIKDDAIASFSEMLPFTNKLIVHTSGATSITAITNHDRRGVFYPLQTFTKDKSIDFKDIPLCIEAAHETDLKLLENLANAISDQVYFINSSQRKALHVAAVFACNFVNHLYQKGEEICNEHQVPFEVLHPLIIETAHKIIQLSPKDSQTGPAVRNDQEVLAKHLSELNTTTQQEIYKLLSKSIQETHGNKL